MSVEPTPDTGREELLALCERAFVPEDAWTDRDSAAAHRQLGECYALLRAGCDFMASEDTHGYWDVVVWSKGFDCFEFGGEGSKDSESYYVPTAARLDRTAGKDWY